MSVVWLLPAVTLVIAAVVLVTAIGRVRDEARSLTDSARRGERLAVGVDELAREARHTAEAAASRTQRLREGPADRSSRRPR